MSQNRQQATFSSSIGELTLIASDKGLQSVHLAQSPAQVSTDAQLVTPYIRAIEAYLSAGTPLPDLPLDIVSGTTLQRRVWKELQTIPYGTTITYSELARRCGNPKAVRAVASACGKNPLPLIIPCHRVIAKDGSLGGFTWGLNIKQHLLQLEGAALKRAA